MDKIIELILEEARRRPGKRFVPKLYEVKLEVDRKIGELVEELLDAERKLKPHENLQRQDPDDLPGKQP